LVIALCQLVDNLFFVVKRSIAQLRERRQKGDVARRLGSSWNGTPAGEQQQDE
jgi:hypothetical protein